VYTFISKRKRVITISHLFLLTFRVQQLLLEVDGAAETFLTVFILGLVNSWLSQSAIFLLMLRVKQLLLEVDRAGKSLRILLLSSFDDKHIVLYN